MINRSDNPLGWMMLITELEDAHEHLGKLIQEISTQSEYSEPELRIDLGHVYAHLNRAWQRRLVAEDFSDAEWVAAAIFPSDIKPVA